MAAQPEVIEDERLSRRTECAHQVHVDAGGTSNYPAAVVDISTSGFRALVTGQVNVGALVRLRFAKGVAPAIVVWRHETLIGCQFIAPIRDHDVAAITQGFGLLPNGRPRFGFEGLPTKRA